MLPMWRLFCELFLLKKIKKDVIIKVVCKKEVIGLTVTIKEVAEKAGVSVATVSRVLNNNPAVSDKTAKIVRETIEELDYRPNFLGRNLRKCETNVILAIFPSSEYSAGLEIVKSMHETASEYGYDIIMATSYDNSKNEMRLLNMLFNRTVDGAVLMSTHLCADEINKISEEYDIALCGEKVDGTNVLTVTVDDVKGAYDAVSELIKEGHTKIAMISTGNEALSSLDREEGYKKALSDAGIEFDENYIFRGGYSFSDGENGYRYLFSLPEPPTAVFAVSDILAMGVAKRALRSEKGKMPKIIGYDNIPLCESYSPTISSVSQPARDIGREIIKKLIENIKSENKCREHIIMPHKIIRRESF